MNITVADCKITDCGPLRSCVNLWRVKGIDNVFYPTKYVAEIAAGQAFPNERATERYARISYKVLWEDGQ